MKAIERFRVWLGTRFFMAAMTVYPRSVIIKTEVEKDEVS